MQDKTTTIDLPEYVDKGYLAAKLWPDLRPKVRVSKFHNKLNGWCRMRFTEEEKKIINDLIK